MDFGKTEIIPFTRKRMIPSDGCSTFFVSQLQLSDWVRCLGIYFDPWNSIWIWRRKIQPHAGSLDIYLNCPTVYHIMLSLLGSLDSEKKWKQLFKLQIHALLGVTGAMKITPASTMEVLLYRTAYFSGGRSETNFMPNRDGI